MILFVSPEAILKERLRNKCRERGGFEPGSFSLEGERITGILVMRHTPKYKITTIISKSQVLNPDQTKVEP